MRIRLLRVAFVDAAGIVEREYHLAPLLCRRLLSAHVDHHGGIPLPLLSLNYASVRANGPVVYRTRQGGQVMVSAVEDADNLSRPLRYVATFQLVDLRPLSATAAGP